MASDEIVWQVINQQFCSFKLKLKATKGQAFCRNEYNVTGLCNRMSCPLANSNYATIRADPSTGAIHLYIKVVERAHLPSKLWERIRLPADLTKAMAIIDSKLAYWPEFLIHKCKQRLIRLRQVAIKTKTLAKEQRRLGETVVPRLAAKVRRRELTRERKAEAAAQVERAIERELLNRLRSAAYGDNPVNVEEGIWKKVLRGLEREGEGIRDVDLDEGIEEETEADREIEWEEEGGLDVEYVSDIDGESEDDDLEELGGWFDGGSDASADESSASEPSSGEDGKPAKPGSGGKRKRPPPAAKPKKKTPRVEIEYEEAWLPEQSVLAR